MAEFAIQIGNAKFGPLCILISIPAASPDEALDCLRERLLASGTQVILSIPALSDYIALKINPDIIGEATIIRQCADQSAGHRQPATI